MEMYKPIEAEDWRSQSGLQRHARGLLIATGSGLLAGYLVGLGAMESFTHAGWPTLAGLVVGMVSSLAAPSRRVLVASWGSSVAVVAAVTKIVLVQFQRGHWPISDDASIAQYGTATQATLRTAVLLGIQIGIPCLIAAALVAVAMRRSTPTDGLRQTTAPGPDAAGAAPGR